MWGKVKTKKFPLHNSLWPSDTIWQHKLWLNNGSGNGLLPSGNNPLPEPMLAYHKWGQVIFVWGPFHKRHLGHQLLKLAWKSIIIKSPRSGVTLCFQFVSAASASATTFASHVKTVWAKSYIIGTKNIWVWKNVLDDLFMTLTKGHGCGID